MRFEVKNGADVIKAAVSGGVLSLADEVDTPQLTPAEMAALVDESHRLRKKVAVHCHGDQAAREAIEAGVDSIEHGSFMKPETLTMMKKKGTFLTPTLMASEWIMGKLDNYPPALQAKAKAATAARSEMFRNAVKMGVKISFGTDAAVFPHGQNAKEFKLMVDLGMNPIDALKSATANDAELLGIGQKVGTLGKRKTGRCDCDAGRSDFRYHCNRACLIRNERRQNHSKRPRDSKCATSISKSSKRRIVV